MADGTVRIKTGEYKHCGGTSLCVRRYEYGCRVELKQPDSLTLNWSFHGDGTFAVLSAESQEEQAEGSLPESLLVCEHIVPGAKLATVIQSISPGAQVGWMCCTDCIQKMLTGDNVHLMDRKLADEMVVETILKVEGGVACDNSKT